MPHPFLLFYLQAFAHYRIALKLNPEDFETRFALGKLLFASVSTYYKLHALHFCKDALEEAEVEFLVVTKLFPAFAPAAQLQLNLLCSQPGEEAPPHLPSHPGVVPVYSPALTPPSLISFHREFSI